MNTFFLDSSAVVRLYVIEAGSQWVRDLLRSAAREPAGVRVYYCDLAFPEAVSALRQIAVKPDAPRRGFSRAAFRQVLPRLRHDLLGGAPLVSVPASGCMARALEVVERQEIRGADAVHVAAALTARESVTGSGPFTFVSHDLAQCRAAEREGLEVMVPS